MLIHNTSASRSTYPDELRTIMNIDSARESRRWLASWPVLSPVSTPIRSMPGLSLAMGVREVWVKDESERSMLGSFKVLGAPIALARLVARTFRHCQPELVLTGRYAPLLTEFVVISATDGNHGRALAAAAQSAGIRCVIVLHRHVSVEREDAISALDAEIVRIDGNYDDSVAEAARLASHHGWQVVSDTSYEGYEDVPRDVMQGYGVIDDEIVEQSVGKTTGALPFTHVIVQGGVGGLAAGMLSYLWEMAGSGRPIFIIVEPRQADCLMQSAIKKLPAKATGTVDSIMAGLACGETSPLAWRFLRTSVDFFLTIEDADAAAACMPTSSS